MKKTITILTIAALVCFESNCLGQIPNAVYFDEQVITINDFPAEGYILDIGGGGEGVIGQLKGDQVISIDPYKDELANAPSSNLKIVMDGRELKFLDHSFNTAALFYTMMYISGDDHAKVFKEIKRVLKHGGKLRIWDVNLPMNADTSKRIAVYYFTFKLPKTEINTGYGARFPTKSAQDMKYYIDLAKKEGFRVLTASNNNNSFFLELQTTPSITDTLLQLIKHKNVESAIKSYEEFKLTKSQDFYFGSDVLLKMSNDLLIGDKIQESLSIFKLTNRDYVLTERDINSFGYALLSKKSFKQAIEIFQLNIDKYPGSSNSYDSIADAYFADGQKELAISNYKKALALNPANRNAKNKLKKLIGL